MKIGNDLVFVQRKDGTTFLRRMRFDVGDKASPAKREVCDHFRQVAVKNFGTTGYQTNDRSVLRISYRQGYYQRGYRAESEHVSRRSEARKSIEKLLKKIKPTFITFMGKIVYVLTD